MAFLISLTKNNKQATKRNQWQIVDKETIDEIIFRTMNIRNRIILELMARGGMRIGEVLNLKPADIQERTLAVQNPKSGRVGESVRPLPHPFAASWFS